MSTSDGSDEFSYQTRLVVYNFLGLVPATPPPSDDDLEGSQIEQPLDSKPLSPLSDALETLPALSLIDRLSEPEMQPFKPTDETIERDERFSKKPDDRFDREVAREAVLNELNQLVGPRGPSPSNLGNEDALPAPITIIQKRNRVKVLGEAITASEEADICRRLSLQPFGSSANLSDVPLGKSSGHMQPHSAGVGGSGSRPFFLKRPTTLLSSSGLTSSREMLTQIDEDQELDLSSEMPAEDGVLAGRSSHDRDVPAPTTPAQNFASGASFLIRSSSVERQNSSMSGSNRRCSTYVDITEVNVENLIKANALPPLTLPLKRELSMAFEQLERNYKAGNSDEVDSSKGGEDDETVMNDARSPESEVADSLRALGDRIQEEYGSQLSFVVQDLLGGAPDRSVNYISLQHATSRLLHETQHGWTRVTLVMLLGQQLIFELLRQGCSGISHMAEFTAMLVEDQAADFIVSSGGWNSINEARAIETETVFTPFDVDYRLLQGFDSNSVNKRILPAIDGNSEQNDVRPSERTIPVERPLDFVDSRLNSKPLHLSCPHTNGVDSLLLEKSGDLLLSPPGMTSTPSETFEPRGPNIQREVRILRQNSQQYMDEMESARRAAVWTQSGIAAGFAAVVLFTSWIFYRQIRRAS